MRLTCCIWMLSLLELPAPLESRTRGLTAGRRSLSGWTACTLKFPNQYCSPAEVCSSDGDCLCPEGSENDGGRGCINLDECAATNYPCPGTRGIESFCVDQDPDNNFYKCGCLPGYRASYSRYYDQRATGIPFQYRPRECVETFLIKKLQQAFMLSIPSIKTTDMNELLEGYKIKHRSMIEDISVRFNKNTRRLRSRDSKDSKVLLSAKEKNIIITVEPTDCDTYSNEAICLVFEINSTYLVEVTEENGNEKKALNHGDVLERYLSNIDGFSNIVHSLDELEKQVKQITINSAYSILSNAFEGIDGNWLPGRIVISPIPKTDDEALIVEERYQSKPGGQTCSSDSECLSGTCRDLDSKCEDERVPYDLFLNFGDTNLQRLENVINAYASSVTDAVATVVKDLDCSLEAGKACRPRLLDSVKFEGYYETSSELFNTDPAVDKNAIPDKCNVASRLTQSTANTTDSDDTLTPSNNSTDPSNNSTDLEGPTFKIIMFFQIVFRCRGCAKGPLYQNDASRRRLRFLLEEESAATELCDADEEDTESRPEFERMVGLDFETSLKNEMPQAIVTVYEGSSTTQTFFYV